MTWPFPPPGGPVPWTPQQESEYNIINAIRMSGVFNMGLSRDKVRELRKSA